MPGSRVIGRHLDPDRVESLKQHLRATGRSAGVGHLACAAIVVGVLHGDVPTLLLAGWMAAVIVATAIRAVALRHPETSLGTLRLAAIVNSAAWGAGLLLLVGYVDLAQLLFLMVVMAGLVAAGATTLAADAPAFYCYLAAMLGPLELSLLMHGQSPVHTGARIIVPVFAIVVIRIQRVARRELLGRLDAERQAAGERAFMSALIASAPIAITTVDRDGNVRAINPAFTTMFGYPAVEALGRSLNALIVPPDGREAAARMDAVVRSGQPVVTEVERCRRDRTMVVVRASAAAATGAAEGTQFVLYDDVTAMRAAEASGRAAHEQARLMAEAAARAKSEFLANMSHEIRTPMNGVLGMTGLLLDSPLNPEQREYADTIRQSGESLLAIINDILDFSKIEAGKLTIEPLPFDLRVAIDEVVDLLSTRAEQKGLALAFRYQPGLRTRFVADAGRIRQIVVNLVANAIKFTEKGHVLIDIAAVESTDGTVVRIAVEDTGIGLTAEAQGRMFQKFSQADASTTRKHGGTGLGLAISRQLAELMGGSVGIESTLGQGSRFWVELPLPHDDQAAPPSLAEFDLAGVRALIVDDTAVNRRILLEQLTHWSMRPTAAASAEEGLRLLAEATAAGDPFKVAIVDYLMPGADGEEFGRAARARARAVELRMIVTTSSGQRGEGDQFKAAGFDGYFVRPVRQSMLKRAVSAVLALTPDSNRFITRHLLAESDQLDPGKSDQPAKTAAPVATRVIRVLLAEDNMVNQKLAVRMLEKIGCRVDVAANGQEAVTMEAQFRFDVILMDCQMPELDGYEATAAIRQREGGTRHTPIVALTANAMAGDREKCLAAGMDDYLSKPVRPEELTAKIRDWAGSTAAVQ